MFNENSIVYKVNGSLLDIYRKMIKISSDFKSDYNVVTSYKKDEQRSVELGKQLSAIEKEVNIRNTSIIAEAMVKADFIHPGSVCRDNFTQIVSEAETKYGEAALTAFNPLFNLLSENGYLLTKKTNEKFNELAFQTNNFDKSLALDISKELKVVLVKMSSGSRTMFVKWEDNALYAYTAKLKDFDSLIKYFNIEPEYGMELIDKSLKNNTLKPLFYYDLDKYDFDKMLHMSIVNSAVFSIQTGVFQVNEELGKNG